MRAWDCAYDEAAPRLSDEAAVNSDPLHKIILPILAPLLITTRRHRLLRKQIIIRMVALMRLLLSLLGHPQLLLLPRLLRRPLPVSEFFQPVLALLV